MCVFFMVLFEWEIYYLWNIDYDSNICYLILLKYLVYLLFIIMDFLKCLMKFKLEIVDF